MRESKANLSPRLHVFVLNALGDRELLRHLQYVQVLDDERKRFGKAPAAFRDSPLGDDVKDALQLARDLAVQKAGQLARERMQRALDELGGHIRYNTRLLESASAGSRGAPDVALAPWRVPPGNAGGIAHTDDDHVLWPFTGEYWRDEGHHQQSIRSRCR